MKNPGVLLSTLLLLLMSHGLLGQDYPTVTYVALPYLADSSTIRTHDTNSFVSIYDFAVGHYNRGIYLLDNMGCGDLAYMYRVQERVIHQFLEALPYAKAANKLQPSHRETLIMLAGIYYSLNDIEKFEQYKAASEKVEPTVNPTGTNKALNTYPVH